MVLWLILSPLFLLSFQVSVSSCDLLVVSVGQMSMGRAVNIVQKLWTVGIPAEIMYDWSQVEILSPVLTILLFFKISAARDYPFPIFSGFY